MFQINKLGKKIKVRGPAPSFEYDHLWKWSRLTLQPTLSTNENPNLRNFKKTYKIFIHRYQHSTCAIKSHRSQPMAYHLNQKTYFWLSPDQNDSMTSWLLTWFTITCFKFRFEWKVLLLTKIKTFSYLTSS